MTVRAIPADEQLTVHCGPDAWYLVGPDDSPVFEVRGRNLFYHPAFGRWRDLPPGNRISADGVENVQVRWERGWAVGVTLKPGGLWRCLVRWPDSRQIDRADDAARALSALIGRPLMTDEDKPPQVTRVGYTPPPLPAAPSVETPLAAPPVHHPPPVYTVDDAADVRLPLRMGSGALLDRDSGDRLHLTVPTGSQGSSLGLTLLGLVALAVFVAVVLLLWTGAFGEEALFGFIVGSAVLVIGGLTGVLLFLRMNRPVERHIIFDRAARLIILSEPGTNRPEELPLDALHGIRLNGEAVRTRSTLAYERTVVLLLDIGDRVIFRETRPTALPPDPAIMPSLAALRRQADDQAGPSLARAGGRVIAWYLGVPLADE